MKTHRLIAVLFAASLSSGFAAELSRTPSPTPTPTPKSPAPKPVGACRYNSWNPELYGFYGAKKTILEKLPKIPETAPFADRRVFVQITEGESGVEVKLFERQDNGTFNTTVWTRGKGDHLICDIDDRIMDNKGLDCVGKTVKEGLVNLLGDGKASAPLAAETAAAAFSPSVNNASGDYIKTIMIILC
jgi:hypothetical protein